MDFVTRERRYLRAVVTRSAGILDIAIVIVDDDIEFAAPRRDILWADQRHAERVRFVGDVDLPIIEFVERVETMNQSAEYFR
jgi:hypothetical protein